MIKDSIFFLILCINSILISLGEVLGVLTGGFLLGYVKGSKNINNIAEYFKYKQIAKRKEREKRDDSNNDDDKSSPR